MTIVLKVSYKLHSSSPSFFFFSFCLYYILWTIKSLSKYLAANYVIRTWLPFFPKACTKTRLSKLTIKFWANRVCKRCSLKPEDKQKWGAHWWKDQTRKEEIACWEKARKGDVFKVLCIHSAELRTKNHKYVALAYRV